MEQSSNWKSIGWSITKKLVYYFLVVAILTICATFAFSLMTVANTLLVILGGLLLVVTFGTFITLTIREIFYFLNKID